MKKKLCTNDGLKMAVLRSAVALAMTACLSGCGDAVPAGSPLGTDAPKDSVSVSDRTPQADTTSGSTDADRKGADDDELLNQNGGTQGSTVETETSPEPADTEQPVASPEPEAPTASPDIDSIAGLGELQAVVEAPFYKNSAAFVVDVENGHNPYDVEWDYGELYDAYIEEADWSLVFDADFYMESFPALAFLYQYDEELLLEHFQTVGVHEGRQGNAAFNVAAYAEHCGQELLDAFGDHYECYYFYWMLNQASQEGIATSGENYPLQLDVKMTSEQAKEFEKVNEYRAEVGVDPLKFDPELAAVACYRGWVDISEGYGAHDWINDEANWERANDLMALLHMTRLGENTVDCGVDNASQHIHNTFHINYRYSPEHYEAMINPEYKYFGCSHIYFGTNRIPASRIEDNSTYNRPMMRVEFDLFTDALSTPMHP